MKCLIGTAYLDLCRVVLSLATVTDSPSTELDFVMPRRTSKSLDKRSRRQRNPKPDQGYKLVVWAATLFISAMVADTIFVSLGRATGTEGISSIEKLCLTGIPTIVGLSRLFH